MGKFDDIFSRKVKEAFENYNADHLAEEGWNAYVSRHGRRRTRAILIPLWARAASIIILVTAGVLFINRLNNRGADETVGQVAHETRNNQADSGMIKTDTTPGAPVITPSTPATTDSDQENTEAATETGSAEPEIAAKVPIIANPVKTSGTRIASAGQPGQSLSGKPAYQENDSAGPLLADATLAEESPLQETAIARQEVPAGVIAGASPLEVRLADEADAGLNLKSKKILRQYPDLPREKMSTTLMTGLSGMMASVDNATSTSQGVSIGFYVEQQLSRRISIRPGLAMARHNYAMESSPGGSMAFDYNAPELNGMSGRTTSYDADIDILSMEIPVNFVFSLWKRSRSNLFVTTGASTVVYLSQSLSGSFNNTYTKTNVDASTGNVSYETMTTSVQIESEQEFLDRIDILGLANFSAGYSLPFGKTTHLLFEPFVQLPIKDLTSMNLRIRYGGLSMKIRF